MMIPEGEKWLLLKKIRDWYNIIYEEHYRSTQYLFPKTMKVLEEMEKELSG